VLLCEQSIERYELLNEYILECLEKKN